MIEIKSVYKTFADKIVLNNVSTVFEPGKVTMVIGRSGSGKTILLKSTIGLSSVDNGEILYNNRDFFKSNIKIQRKIREEMGMVFQGGALFTSATVQENVIFPLDLFTDWTKAEKLKRVNFCLNRVNIEDANNLYPGELSGGMQKRVAIARAIVLNPKYLFCDEPNSGLDPQTSIVIDKLIKELTLEYNMTTIVNTHDMNSVMGISDKIYFLYEGQIEWEGVSDDIFNSENQNLNDFVFASEFFRKAHSSGTINGRMVKQ
ncbi:MAG: ATP-binding cassette domain-containing protein [Bacteroidales bacterium]|jgi:phospholipid/cholesterol/gamma-HCH transport system ATP-binding protein|nr:ATP-binding cassette domain-containing protein [Bacteroidales bacterium]